MKRNRLFYFLGVCAVVLMGLASRRFSDVLPRFIALYAGDTLWALMIFLGLGFLFARWPTNRIAVGAVLFCYAIEFSQIYHTPWIDALRDTRLGGLILGYGFLWSDMICYSAGVFLGWLGEKIFARNS